MLVGIPIALVVLGSAGIPIASLLPLVLVLACMSMMMGMHGGHRGCGGHEKKEVANRDGKVGEYKN